MPRMTRAPRPKLEKTVIRSSDTGLGGSGVGVERGISVGVGEEASRNGVGTGSSSSTGARERALRQKIIRSMTTANEIIEQASSGTITGPPLMIMPIKSNTVFTLS